MMVKCWEGGKGGVGWWEKGIMCGPGDGSIKTEHAFRFHKSLSGFHSPSE